MMRIFSILQSLSGKCSDQNGWCDPNNPAPAVASQIMAKQLADSLFGFTNNWDERILEALGLKAKNVTVTVTPSTSNESTGKLSRAGLWILQ